MHLEYHRRNNAAAHILINPSISPDELQRISQSEASPDAEDDEAEDVLGIRLKLLVAQSLVRIAVCEGSS